MSNNFIEIAWAAGFLDGEGNFNSYRQRTAATYRYRIQCTQVARQPLDRLQVALGGKVYGPYGPYASNKQAYFQWTVEGESARGATEKLMPYLCDVKAEQARSAMEVAA
jgi:hypothetical protein